MFTNQIRFTGMSGIDTATLVNQIMRAERIRYDRMGLQRTRLSWQQEAMHSIMTSAQSFQRTFFDVLNPSTNMLAPGRFLSFNSQITAGGIASNAVNVSGGQNSQVGTYRMTIHGMAQAERFSFQSTAMQSPLSGQFRSGSFASGDSIQISVNGGANHTISFNTAEANILNNGDNAAIENMLNNRLAEIYGQATDSDGNPIVGASRFVNFRLTGTGSDRIISLVADQGNSATLHSGTSRGGGTGSFNLTSFITGGINQNELNNLIGEGFSVRTADGTIRRINVNTNGVTTAAQMASALNNGLRNAGVSGLNFEVRMQGGQMRMGLEFTGDEPVEILAPGGPGNHGNALANLGIPGASSEMRLSSALVDMGFRDNQSTTLDLNRTIEDVFGITANGAININGTSVSFTANQTVRQFMDNIASTGHATLEFDNLRQEFRLSATGTGHENRLRLTAPNSTQGNNFLNMVRDDTNPLNHHQVATDARVTITDPRGISFDLERSSNTFSFDGMTVTLNSIPLDSSGAPQEITILNQRDVDGPLDLIRDFVESFNELFDSVRLAHTTPRANAPNSSRPMEPLTEEERAAMSDRDIENWEARARIGLLHRNNDLSTMTRMLRDAITESVPLAGGGRISLFEIGITTTREGTLEITDEDRLREALLTRPDDVAQLFTRNPADAPTLTGSSVRERMPMMGISQRINDIIHFNISPAFGRLTEQAGSPTATTRSVMLDRMVDMDRRLEVMRTDLVRRENAHFARFSAMERAIMNSNSQMDMIWSMMGQA